MERAANDEEVAEFLRDNQKTVESIFVSALRRAQSRGELAKDKDVRALARFFVVTIQGMRAIAKLNSNRKALQAVAKVALSALD